MDREGGGGEVGSLTVTFRFNTVRSNGRRGNGLQLFLALHEAPSPMRTPRLLLASIDCLNKRQREVERTNGRRPSATESGEYWRHKVTKYFMRSHAQNRYICGSWGEEQDELDKMDGSLDGLKCPPTLRRWRYRFQNFQLDDK